MADIKNKIRQVLIKWSVRLVQDIQKAIDDTVTHQGGQTSKLSESVNPKVTMTNEGVTFQITMADYWRYVDGDGSEWGRRPNQTPPPTRPIKEWLKQKGLSQAKADSIILGVQAKHRGVSLRKRKGILRKRELKVISFDKKLERISWMYSKSIGKKGIKARPFLKKAVKPKLDELQTMLAPIIKEQYILDIKSALE